MRPWSLIALALVFAGCTIRPVRPAVIMKVDARVRIPAVDVRVNVPPPPVQVVAPAVQVEGTVEVAPPPVQVEVAPPPVAVVVEAPPVAVELEGAAVVEFFGIPLEGASDVVFVLDCSGSMSNVAQGRIAQIQVAGAPPPADPSQPTASGQSQPAPQKMQVANQELAVALERLAPGTRTNVIFFNHNVDAYAPALTPLDEDRRADLITFVRETGPSGTTALGPAMRTAFLMNARRIVLLSDGLGNVGGDASDILRDAREGMRGGVRIDTIGLGYDQDADLLGALARESGGLYQAL